MKKPLIATVATLGVTALLVPATPAAAVDAVDSSRLRKAVTVGGILEHERALQKIATQNGGNRAATTPGYDASVTYVTKKLRKAGFKVRTQTFTFPLYREVAPASLAEIGPEAQDFPTATFDYSASGDVTGTVVPVRNLVLPPTDEPSSTAGCNPDDFAPASSTEPQVSLIQRGGCDFEVKAANAAAAGYDAVIIFNEGQPGREELLESVTLNNPAAVPVVGASFATGEELAAAAADGAVTVRVTTSTEIDLEAKTKNVIADSPKGKTGTTVVVGAHLDSVFEGPGINDNGSGTSTLIEIAEQMKKLGYTKKGKLQRQVRFAFWGAEEEGLLGSQAYVDSLSPEQLSRIYANLNFDMVGSPNYVRFVYDGDGSAFETPGPAGSGAIEKVFTDYFAGQGLASAPTEFDGRSDYGAFIDAGIPAGGLFSGAEGIKTDEEAEVYGGTAGAPYDPCYHQACDTVSNLNEKALNELGDAAAHATLVLARSKSGLFVDGSRVAQRSAADSAPAERVGVKVPYRGSKAVA